VGIDRCERLLLSGRQSSCEEKTAAMYLEFVFVVDLQIAAAPNTLQTKPSEIGREAEPGLLLAQ
jgi:hypothetical protein